MIQRATEKLLSISSDAISRLERSYPEELSAFGRLGEELKYLLENRNGFYAFESALHVFPAAHFSGDMTLGRWNSHGLWKFEYAGMADGKFFFAEDVFGNQFCLFGNEIGFFEAETAETQMVASGVEEWASLILKDYAFQTGYPLVHTWQKQHGPLSEGQRLMPKIPFVLGGEFKVENLFEIRAISGMKSRGNLARQIKDLPDGSKIKFEIID